MIDTIETLLERARDAEDSAEALRWVLAAADAIANDHDARTVLARAAAIPAVTKACLAQIAARTLHEAVTHGAVWGFRDVAQIRAERLDDPEGARAALELGVQTLHANAAPGYAWAIVARGFTETLRDADGLRRGLEAGLQLARSRLDAEDLRSIATVWGTSIDLEEGRALLRDAETMAKNSPWGLANAWRELGEPGEAERVLDAAERDATSCADALHVVAAWASHGVRSRASAAWARARTLARSVDDWLAVAETAFDIGLGPDEIRGAIAGAEALASDLDARRRVSTAYKCWLNDDEAADALGPRGVRPEALRSPGLPLANCPASASALFDHLRRTITVEALTTIAHADYGHGADKHLAVLKDICATGLLPKPLAWEPHEVLALTRWSSGPHVDHVARAFSCTLLCLAPGGIDEFTDNGPILAESCIELGPEATTLAIQFFAWYAGTLRAEDDEVELDETLALLLLISSIASVDADDPRIDGLARALLEPPHDINVAFVGERIEGSMRADLWQHLLARTLGPLRDREPIATLLGLLGPLAVGAQA